MTRANSRQSLLEENTCGWNDEVLARCRSDYCHRTHGNIFNSASGAEAGTRTPMTLRPLAPEASASANFATSAQ